MFTYFDTLTTFQAGALASLIASLATGLGALPILWMRSASTRLQDILLGLAAGLMLGATVFSLVNPALIAAGQQTLSTILGALLVGGVMLTGGLALWVAHGLLPHQHFVKGIESLGSINVRGIWLFVVAITVHNFPEGMSVGVSFGGGNVNNGLALTTAIFLQNLPEGFAVALALLPLKYSPATAVLISFGTGVVETVGGLVGAGVVTVSAALLPVALSFAAGAMLFVISHEVIPETHRNGHETPATFGVMVGFVVMMFLDVAFA